MFVSACVQAIYIIAHIHVTLYVCTVSTYMCVAMELRSSWVVWPGRLGFRVSEHHVAAFGSSSKLSITYGVADFGPDDVVENKSIYISSLANLFDVPQNLVYNLTDLPYYTFYIVSVQYALYLYMYQNMRSVSCAHYTQRSAQSCMTSHTQVGNLMIPPRYICMHHPR